VIRFFDLVFSFLGLIILLPFLILIGLVIVLDSRGGIFYLQNRVGKGNIDFRLIKFRTMRKAAEMSGSLTIGSKDSRITGAGYFLRRYKLDELPQLVNVLKGDMSIVGPRPEVRKYVELYNEDQKKVLNVRPGITDIASLEYFNENELLAASTDPEKTYIEKIMPAKLEMNRNFIESPGTDLYLKIIGRTLAKLFR
jgi:lipopolysaccharide/colanic/teichoic acid biosynthesis glycosyltransferase